MRRFTLVPVKGVEGIHRPLRRILSIIRVGAYMREREIFDKNRLPKKQTGTTL